MPGQSGSSTHIALLGWLYVYREVQTSMMNTTRRVIRSITDTPELVSRWHPGDNHDTLLLVLQVHYVGSW